ncbi:MAG TPA: LamG domain-containing protein, partial [Patescibacteria group bacterium]|nr:LamG domain-containing protein [Patescibacteria group bacterium]
KFDENSGQIDTAESGMLVYRGGADTNRPEYKEYTGGIWGAEGQALDISDAFVQRWIKVEANPKPDSEEKVMCNKDSGSDVNCQVWSGSSWGNLAELSISAQDQFGFNIAYEQKTGRSMVCYANTADSGVPYCNIWNGTDWTTSANASTVGSGINSLKLFPDPNSNYIALMTSDTADDINVQIWNGSSWGSLQEVETGSTGLNNDYPYSGAWDSNGDFMALWVDDTDDEVEGRQFDKAAGWGSQIDGVITGLSTAVDAVATVRAVAHPSNGYLLAVVADEDDTVEGNYWNGSSWSTQTQLEDSLGAGVVVSTSNLVDVAYEQSGDYDGIITYGNSPSALKYRIFDSDSPGFGSEQSLPTSSDTAANWHQLSSDPTSDDVMLTLVGSVNDVDTLEWNGSAWESAFTNQETASDGDNWNASFAYSYMTPATVPVYDTSGNANHGAFSANMTGNRWVNGKFGSALDFDGTDDVVYIDTASDSGVDFNGSEAFSGSAWVYIKTMPGLSQQDAIIAKWDTTSGTRSYRLFVENDDNDTTGNFQVGIYDESANQNISASGANDTVSANTWYHVAFTFNGGTAGAAGDLKLYTNGTLTNSNTANASFLGLEDTATDFTIGDYDSTDIYAYDTAFTGIIDDVKIYSYVRSNEEIVEDMNAGHPAPGSPVGSAVGHWKFDEGSLNTCSGGSNDACNSGSSGNTLDLAITAATLTNSGKFGKALNLDGTDDYASITDNAVLSITDSLSLSAWIYRDNTSREEMILGKWNETSQRSYILYVSSGDLLVFGVSVDGAPGVAVNSSTVTLSSGQWYHVAATFDPTTQTGAVYVNGKLANSSDTNISSIYDSTATFYIGENTGAGVTNDFDGKIDEVKIFRSALTADQVKLLYNQSFASSWGTLSTDASGNASNSDDRSFCPPGDATANCGPTAYWKMDEGAWTVNCSTDSVFDSSGNGAVGDACPNSTGPAGGSIGKYGNAGNFDGNDYLNMGDTNDQTTNDFTISAWVKRANTTSYHVIMSKGGGSEPSYFFGIQDTDILRFVIRDSVGQTVADSTSTINDTNWHYVAVT